MFWELYSVISVKELPNRNCFRINSVIILCVMVNQRKKDLSYIALPQSGFSGLSVRVARLQNREFFCESGEGVRLSRERG